MATTVKIVGSEEMSREQVEQTVRDGGKFVYFQYCISVVVMTFKRPSDIYFIPAGESSTSKSLGFSAISLFFGWWGIPWGPIYTIGSFITNLGGGKDVSSEVLASLQQPIVPAMPTAQRT